MGSGCGAFSTACRLGCLAVFLVFGHLNQAIAGVASKDPLQDPEAAHALSIGQPVERDLRQGQVHFFQILLRAGQILRAEIFSRNLSLAVSLRLQERSHSLEWIGPEGIVTPIVFVGSVAGDYTLSVRPLRKQDAAGRYKLVITALRQASAQDRRQVAASKAVSKAEELRMEQSFASCRKALKMFEQALTQWHAAGDQAQEVSIMNRIGSIYAYLSEYSKAVSAHQTALLICRKSKNLEGEGATLNEIVYAYASMGENQKSLDAATRALECARASGAAGTESRALYNLGYAQYNIGDTKKALDYAAQALRMGRLLEDRQGVAASLRLLGWINHALKQAQEAWDFYYQSLQLYREIENFAEQGATLAAMGHLSNILGEREQAFVFYRDSLKLFRAIGDRVDEKALLIGISYAYLAMGENQKALDCLLEALSVSRDVGDTSGETEILTYLGETYLAIGDLNKSLQCSLKAVSLSRATGSDFAESLALTSLAKAYEARAEPDKALENYARALELSRKTGERFQEGLLLDAVGNVHHRAGEIEIAQEYYGKALSAQIASNDLVGQSRTLFNLARAERDSMNPEEGIRKVEDAIQIIESLRTKVASSDLRASYLGSVRSCYDLYIDLLMQMHHQHPDAGFVGKALQASERGRARSLLESLIEARSDIRQGIDPSLLKRERSLQQLLISRVERQTRRMRNERSEESEALATEIRDLTNELEELQVEIRNKSPHYAALTQPQPLDLKEIQRQVLDSDTMLLEYTLGDDRSYLWAVTPSSLYIYSLPKRSEIEEAVHRVRGLLLVRQSKEGETPQQYQQRTTDSDEQYWREAGALSQMLLGPVSDRLGSKRLLVVAEGALQYLPLGALPNPAGKGTGRENESDGNIWYKDSSAGVPLIVEHEIVCLPSASVLAVLRSEIRDRASPAKTLAVLADPVFETDDPRVKKNISNKKLEGSSSNSQSTIKPAAGSIPSPDSTLSRLQTPIPGLNRILQNSDAWPDASHIARLPGTRREAEAILSVAPSNSSLKALDFMASRSTATNPELRQYRIVHFATHGLLDSEHPELSGIVLSLVDERGRKQNGTLRLNDIYNLNLPVDLVVLSTCNSALGKDVRGEGLLGIVRGFMYAGAGRVVASLWKVEDDATAELMKRFYQHMLQGGEPAAAALRSAQVGMWGYKKWSFPYYWAAFVLQGEWR
jgi:tetratricopeptide (TPR) repeat protein